jgi:KDO2-lipid IV(A) lauroyltransferase
MASRNIFQGRFGIPLGLALARWLPPRAGHWVSEQIGLSIALRRNFAQVRALRANQFVVGGGSMTSNELEYAVRAVYRASGRCLYDFYHHVQNRTPLEHIVEISPSFQQVIERSRTGQAQFLVIPHYSNFDLVGVAAVQAGLNMQILSYSHPPVDYRMQNDLRVSAGMEVTPISVDSLRLALERLRAGGTVLTAADRPLAGVSQPQEERPLFFSRPADLPTGYLRIAMRAQALLVIVSGVTLPDGRYRLWASEALPPPPAGARADEIKRCAEEILACIAELIRANPHHWFMFYPVWPEAVDETPA